MVAPFFRFVKQTHKRNWFSDDSFEAVGGRPLQQIRIKAVKKGGQEGARGGREPDAGEETANVEDYQVDGGKHRRMGCCGGG